MSMNIGILLFDDCEELDFAGPYEVFAMAKLVSSGRLNPFTISERGQAIRAAKGLRVTPDHSFDDAPKLDALLVPGGHGTRNEDRIPPLVEWLRKTGPGCQWVTSVCTGALLLERAGLLRGKSATTNRGYLDMLEERGKGTVTVARDVRYVRDGNVVTSGGVSAGIDMSLWLVGQWIDVQTARRVQRGMEYAPAPPYAADV